MTNLSNAYNANELSFVASPCIHIGPTTTSIKLEFDLIRDTEAGYDKAWLEYSIDAGINWQKVLKDSIHQLVQ